MQYINEIMARKKNDIEMYSPYNEKKSVPTVDLLETSRIKCIITWLQYQKCVYWYS